MASALAALCLCACTKENVAVTESVSEPVIVNVTPATTKSIEDYYSNWAGLVGKFIDNSAFSITDIAEKLNFPEIGRLSELDIRDCQGSPIKFKELSKNEQAAFIACAAVELAGVQCAKAVKISAICREFGYLNELIVSVSKFADKLINAGTSVDVIADKIKLVADSLAIIRVCSPFPAAGQQPETKSVIGFEDVHYMPYQEFRSKMAGVARKGDILAILPVFGHPETLVNLKPSFVDFEDGGHHQMGHSAIVTDDFRADTPEDEKLIFSAISKGVEYEPSSAWCTEFYLMEPVKLQFVWNPLNSKTPLTISPVKMAESEVDEFIQYAQSFEHASFINHPGLEWFYSKKLVPDRFTCASFIWYCCKNVYGFDISVPFIPTVAPINLVCSPYTIIKSAISPDTK